MKFVKHLFAGAALAAMGTAASAFPIAAPGTEGFVVIVTSTDDIIATYQGNSASYSNDLYLHNNGLFLFNNHASAIGSTVNLGSFAIGTELVFRLHVNNTGNDYFTGEASRNPDKAFHARVQSNWQTNESLVSFEDLFNGPFDFNDLSFSFTSTRGSAPAVPEPASWAMMIGGLGIVGAAMRRRKVSVSFA
jgi:hypothetical protein